MIKDKRKTRRRGLSHTAWILLGPGQLYGCVVSDISDAGARIDVEDSSKVPDRFPLLLALNGKVRRACRVAWRKPTQLGVKFERLSAGAPRKPARPRRPAVEAAPAPAPELVDSN